MTQQSGNTPFDTDHIKDFTGREWVFAEIDRWLADPEGPSFFIITGEPGVGKSAIAARLTQVRDIAAYHFCIARRATTIDPALFARSISQQFCRFDGFAAGILKDSNIDLRAVQNIQANYGQAIAFKIENLVLNAPTASAAFVHAVLEPLRVLCAGGFDRQIVILVDALDEAVRCGGETIVELLANAGVLPRQVRFVLTSHPEGAALDSFKQQRIQYFPLDAGQPENLNDIRRYVRGQLNANADLRARLAENALNDETFIERVTTASEGNFLYLVWQLPAIAAGTQSFDRLEALPQGLVGMYFDFLKRSTEVEKKRPWHFYRPLLGMLAAAQEPLSEQQLAGFTGLSDQDVHDILAASRQFLDPKAAEQGRYHFYHQSWIDFLVDRGKAGDFWIDLVPIHRQVGNYYLEQFKSDWSRCDLYGLRYLGTHMRQGKDCKQVSELLGGAFLGEKARRLGEVSALVEAHEYATFLGHCGEEHWPSLIKAAQDYCGRLEGLHRAAQSTVEKLLERQEIQQLKELVEAEEDGPRQGLLMLAVSVLLDGAGYYDVASSLWKRGIDTARAAEYDHPQRELADALLTEADVSSPPLGARQECSFPEEVVGRGYPSYSDLRGTVAHSTVPTGMFLASYVGGYLTQEYEIHLVWELVFICLSGYLYLWLWRLEPRLGNPGVMGGIGLLATFLGSRALLRTIIDSLTKKAARNWLMRRPLAIHQVFGGMLVAFRDASRSERTAILERTMRLHQSLLRASAPAEPKPSSPWLDIVSQMVKRTISECETPKEAAHWLQECADTDVGYELVAALSEGLNSLKPHWCAPIFSESFRRLPSGKRRYVLRVLAQVWDRLADPQVLLDGLADMDMTEKESRLEVIGQLSGAPRSFLAKTLLLTLKPSGAVHRRTRVWELGREFGQYLSHAWWQLVRTFRFPLCHLEVVLQSLIWLPLFPGLLVVGVLALVLAIFSVPMVSINYLAGMTNDPFRLGALRHVDDPLELCHRIEKALSMGGDISSRSGRRILNTVFAVRLLGQGAPEAGFSVQYPADRVLSVLVRLNRGGLLRQDPKLVLAYMSDQQILQELATLSAQRRGSKPIVPPTLAEHKEQLQRVLPIPSALRSILTRSILSCFWVALWLGAAAWLAPSEVSRLLVPLDLLVLLSLCVAFTTYQHVLRDPTARPLAARLDFAIDKGPIWLLFFLATVSFVFINTANLGVVVSELTILLLWTNLLIPEFIARWRGADLLYPTWKRLWLQRALAICMLCMGCLILAMILVGLSHFSALLKTQLAVFP